MGPPPRADCWLPGRSCSLRCRRVASRLCPFTSSLLAWLAAIKVMLLIAAVNYSPPGNLQDQQDSRVLQQGSSVMRPMDYSVDPVMAETHRESSPARLIVNDVIDDGYSDLELDELRNFQIPSGPEIILKQAPSHINFLIKEASLCEKNSNRLKKRRGDNLTAGGSVAPVKFGGSSAEHQAEGRLQAVAVVGSAVRNFRERQNVRSTWGHPDSVHSSGIPVVFMVGASSSPGGQRSLVKESLLYRDIVQADFLDSYNNLTLKSLSGASWAARFCPQARWVLKTDDDMAVNVFALSNYLQDLLRDSGDTADLERNEVRKDGSGVGRSGSIVDRSGCLASLADCVLCDKLSESARVVGGNEDRFGVSAGEYRGATYPPYCHGVGYLIPTASVHKMMAAAPSISFLRVEDVFMTGLLARASGLRLHRMHSYTKWLHALHPSDKINYFINGTRLTLELDRDLEGSRLSGPQVWARVLQQHGQQPHINREI